MLIGHQWHLRPTRHLKTLSEFATDYVVRKLKNKTQNLWIYGFETDNKKLAF